MKLSAPVPRLVKLQRPPPEIRIFSAMRSAWSVRRTRRPCCPARAAQKSPAAPAPTIATSKRSGKFRARRRRGSGSPREGEHQLLHETVRHVIADDAVAVGPRPLGPVRGAEGVIEEGEVRRVVAIDPLVVLRVVPVVEVRRDD